MSNSELPSAAAQAWDAYKAMERTKQRHLGFLQELGARHPEGGTRTIAENVYLKRLLEEHDEQVTKFRKTMGDLLRSDLRAHASLIEYIKQFNATLGTEERPH